MEGLNQNGTLEWRFDIWQDLIDDLNYKEDSLDLALTKFLKL